MEVLFTFLRAQVDLTVALLLFKEKLMLYAFAG
jgi:hypothetical protein